MALDEALGVNPAGEIDIRPAANRCLPISAKPRQGRGALRRHLRECPGRAAHRLFFRPGELQPRLVVGTGDLSELGARLVHLMASAITCRTYNPNASVSKTLIQHLIRFVAASGDLTRDGRNLADILATEISPELVPAGADGAIQSTESVVGPMRCRISACSTRRGTASPSKIAYLAWNAWHDAEAGRWRPIRRSRPARLRFSARSRAGFLVFLRRFFEQSQFKRSALPKWAEISSGGPVAARRLVHPRIRICRGLDRRAGSGRSRHRVMITEGAERLYDLGLRARGGGCQPQWLAAVRGARSCSRFSCGNRGAQTRNTGSPRCLSAARGGSERCVLATGEQPRGDRAVREVAARLDELGRLFRDRGRAPPPISPSTRLPRGSSR